MQWNWIKRRWFEFRIGHGTYLSFLLGFSNFLLIIYNLLIERIPLLQTVFPSLSTFVIISVTIYIPLAVLVGRHHNKKQLETDVMFTANANPMLKEILERIKRIEENQNPTTTKQH